MKRNKTVSVKRALCVIISALLILMLLSGCTAEEPEGQPTEDTEVTEEPLPEEKPSPTEEPQEAEEPEEDDTDGFAGYIYAHVNGETLTIMPEDNSSADAFTDLLEKGDVTVDLHDYGSFEKVGPLGSELPANDEKITTESGDLLLYQGDQITLFYDTNTWEYTRLGKVMERSQNELKELLGDSDVTITFSLSPETPDEGTSDVLVACFSYTGNTREIADYIAEALGADTYEIRAETPYTAEDTAYNTDCRAKREQDDPSARAAIKGDIPDLSGFDIIYLGYPIWYGQAPKIIYTFLEGADIGTKTVIPFCTSEASPLGSSADNLHESAPDADWEDGTRFEIGTPKEDIIEWLS